jgi:protein MpaA
MARGWSVKFVSLCLVCLVAAGGCYEPEPRPRVIGEDPPVILPEPPAAPPQYRLAGRSVQGRPIMTQVLGQGAATILIMATIHGNEPAGTPLVQELAEHLRANPELLEGRRVVLMPLANPDGLAAGSRENIRGVDLNRNFEADNRVNNGTNGLRALSEPEARAVKAVIDRYKPDRIVSIHQPLNCIDYDGPGRALAARLAQYCELPVKKLGARPGSLGSYTGEGLGIPTITLELPKSASDLDKALLWERYGRAPTAAIAFPQYGS